MRGKKGNILPTGMVVCAYVFTHASCIESFWGRRLDIYKKTNIRNGKMRMLDQEKIKAGK